MKIIKNPDQELVQEIEQRKKKMMDIAHVLQKNTRYQMYVQRVP